VKKAVLSSRRAVESSRWGGGEVLLAERRRDIKVPLLTQQNHELTDAPYSAGRWTAPSTPLLPLCTPLFETMSAVPCRGTSMGPIDVSRHTLSASTPPAIALPISACIDSNHTGLGTPTKRQHVHASLTAVSVCGIRGRALQSGVSAHYQI
jgi:hypothetical protein